MGWCINTDTVTVSFNGVVFYRYTISGVVKQGERLVGDSQEVIHSRVPALYPRRTREVVSEKWFLHKTPGKLEKIMPHALSSTACVVPHVRKVPPSSEVRAVVNDWVIKGLGMSSRVCVTG